MWLALIWFAWSHVAKMFCFIQLVYLYLVMAKLKPIFSKLNELDNPHEVDAQSKSRMSMHNMQIYIKKSAHQLVAQNVNKQTDERRKTANIRSENRVKKRRTVGMLVVGWNVWVHTVRFQFERLKIMYVCKQTTNIPWNDTLLECWILNHHHCRRSRRHTPNAGIANE